MPTAQSFTTPKRDKKQAKALTVLNHQPSHDKTWGEELAAASNASTSDKKTSPNEARSTHFPSMKLEQKKKKKIQLQRGWEMIMIILK